MLTPAEIEQFDRDGYLIFPELFSLQEVSLIQKEIARLQADSPYAVRQKDGEVRLFYSLHDEKAQTPSPLFTHMARTPRLLGTAQQVLRDDQVYMYHSKCNVKEAITGEIFQWHQDFGVWQFDGVPRPDAVTFMVMAQEASELSGCLYFLPGSHKLGVQDPDPRDTTSASSLRNVPAKRMIEIMKEFPRPVAVSGKPGTCAIFHSNLMHASGHNLSKDPRWHIYFVYNPVANQPAAVANPRPSHQCARDFTPMTLVSDNLPR
jgi:ectoine hydroxylase